MATPVSIHPPAPSPPGRARACRVRAYGCVEAALFATLALAAVPASAAAIQNPEAVAHAALSATPLFDGHNDLPWQIREAAAGNAVAYDLRREVSGHTDIARLRAGMVGAQFWSVYVPVESVEYGAARTQLEQIDIAKQLFGLYPDVFEETLTVEAAERAFADGKIASVMGMEGGHAIENSLGALRAFYDMGVRYMTLTHFRNTDWADSGTDEPVFGGLSPFGEEVVREMNRLGMLVDLSHTSPETMHDALDIAEAPVIFSHSSARGLLDHPRNVPDDVLERLSANGGVVMVTFVPQYINEDVAAWDAQSDDYKEANPAPRATLGDVADHIEHVRRVGGVDHVGIGSDFDGISSVPVGLEDVSTFPALFAELARRGWSQAELEKLAGGNVLRAWRAAEAASARLRRERPPSAATIGPLDRRE